MSNKNNINAAPPLSYVTIPQDTSEIEADISALLTNTNTLISQVSTLNIFTTAIYNYVSDMNYNTQSGDGYISNATDPLSAIGTGSYDYTKIGGVVFEAFGITYLLGHDAGTYHIWPSGLSFINSGLSLPGFSGTCHIYDLLNYEAIYSTSVPVYSKRVTIDGVSTWVRTILLSSSASALLFAIQVNSLAELWDN